MLHFVLKYMFVFELVWIPTLVLQGVRGQQDGYCFRFTWLGPGFNNYTAIPNNFCEDITTSPCIKPLTIPKPNYTEVWSSTERENYTCRLGRDSVCAKWIHYFDKEVVNISYLCTRISVQGEGAMKSGCYTQYIGSHSIQVCACRTLTPSAFPCNHATHQAPAIQLLIVSFVVVFSLLALKSNSLHSCFSQRTLYIPSVKFNGFSSR